MIRAFLGIEMPGEVRAALAALGDHVPAGRVVAPENLHMTLAFLGEQPEPVLEEVHLGLEAMRVPGFAVRLAGLGTFGARSPRVLFAAVAASDALEHLHRKVRGCVRQAGLELPRERFRPHVTLARFSGHVAAEDQARLARFLSARGSFAAGPFQVRAVAMFRSTLNRGGARYDVLESYPLSG